MKWLKKIQYNSPVVLSFAIISFLALLLGNLTNGWTTTNFFCVYRSSLLHPLTYVRLFGHILGHANLEHFTNNMLLILLLGPMLEEKYGSKILLIMISLTAFLTGVLHCLFFSNGLLGASGIVFMMIILSSMVSLGQGRIPLTLILAVAIYLGQEVTGLVQKDNISQMTHILGGICGGIYGFILSKRSK